MIAGLPENKASELVAVIFMRGAAAATVVFESAITGIRLLREEDGRA